MSCGCGDSPFGGNDTYNNLCNSDTPYPITSAESVPSLISNLTYALYGEIQKDASSGKVVWVIPCDPNNSATAGGVPRNAGEGLMCYLMRAINTVLPNGTLEILAGGTGSTTAAGARAALGINTTNIGAVPTGRTITASTGLSGGGNLSANRSFAVKYGTASGTAVQGNDRRMPISVTDYGAIPDGNTDSTAAFYNAYIMQNLQFFPYVPAGDYRFSGPTAILWNRYTGPGAYTYFDSGFNLIKKYFGIGSQGPLNLYNEDQISGKQKTYAEGFINIGIGELRLFCDLNGDGVCDAHLYSADSIKIVSDNEAVTVFKNTSSNVSKILFDNNGLGSISLAAGIVARGAELLFISAGSEYVTLEGLTGAFRPVTSGNRNLGTATYKWATVYATTGTINTSDLNQKQDIEELSDCEKRVALKLKNLVKKFRFKDAVEKKGDNARIHVGVIAQDVVAAFASEGLDAMKYGMLCYDEWDASEGTPAGNSYGVRYEELLAFIISAF